ncbi:MAG: hypothetical protein IKL42_04790, partial [Clostridia bacterium]|nr:hypothetical protein [Clostridia bacterium]
ITPKNNGSPQYRATNVPIDDNAYYEFSFNMYSDYFTETVAPTIWLYYQDVNKADIKCIKLYMRNAGLHSGEWKKYTYILPSYIPKSTEPEAEYMSMQIKIPAEISSIYFDDISLRTVTAYNEENLLSNASFEQFDVGGTLRNWTAGNIENISLSEDTHKDICSIGINNTTLYTSALVDGGKTYLFYTWFNASNLTSAASYPTLRVQVGDFVSTTDFTDAFDKKDSGWYKLATEVTIPDSVAENASATVALIMNGADTGYFDDVSFKLKGRTGYTLRNLKTSTSDSSITVEYDINSHFTEDGGTVIYVFFDADGRLLTMEKESAAFGGAHITRTFDKVNFASMKIFVWDSLGGMLPYSNVIQ